jgi:hypothetical protein
MEKKRGGKKQTKKPAPINHNKADCIEFSKNTSCLGVILNKSN